MSPYESLVDPASFGTVVRYLHHPDKQIHFVLHVKDESMLAAVAAYAQSSVLTSLNTSLV